MTTGQDVFLLMWPLYLQERGNVRGVWEPLQFQLAEPVRAPSITGDVPETLYSNECLMLYEKLYIIIFFKCTLKIV